MNKVVKIKKNNTMMSKPSQEVAGFTWVEDQENFYTLKKMPISIELINNLAQELVNWAREDGALKISEFYLRKGITRQAFYSLAKRYPVLDRAKDAALELMGNRREIGMIERRYESSSISSMMHLYDPDWKAAAEWRSSLKKDEQSAVDKAAMIAKFLEPLQGSSNG